MELLEEFRPCFTAPTFITFAMLAAGLIARPAGRTVCGMLAGAGLAGCGAPRRETARHVRPGVLARGPGRRDPGRRAA
jgi:hypothetical protein